MSNGWRPRPAHDIDVAPTSRSRPRPTIQVTEHPQWFRHRPDGTIAYAENPPKRYEDIYRSTSRPRTRPALNALLDVVRFWVERRTRIPRRQPAHQALRVLGVAIAPVHGRIPM